MSELIDFPDPSTRWSYDSYPFVGHAVIESGYRAGGTWFDTRCGQSLYQQWCSLKTLVVDERVMLGFQTLTLRHYPGSSASFISLISDLWTGAPHQVCMFWYFDYFQILDLTWVPKMVFNFIEDNFN